MVKSLSRNKFWHRFTAFSQISPYMPWYSSIYPVVSKCIPLSPDHGWYVNIINPWLTSNICIYTPFFPVNIPSVIISPWYPFKVVLPRKRRWKPRWFCARKCMKASWTFVSAWPRWRWRYRLRRRRWISVPTGHQPTTCHWGITWGIEVSNRTYPLVN